MASKTFSTNVNGLSCVCEYSTSISGTYPNVKFNFNYAFKIKQAYTNSFYEGDTTFKFGSKTHTLYVGRVSGIGTSGVLASGTLSLDFGTARTSSKSVTVSMTSLFTGGASASTTVTESLTIPEPVLNASIVNVTYNSVKFYIDLSSNPNDFYKVNIKDSSRKYTIDNASNGAIITGLSEETDYTFYVEAWCKSGSGTYVKRITLTTKTLVDQLKMDIKINGVWKTGKVFVKRNGVWKKGKKRYLKQNGVWN